MQYAVVRLMNGLAKDLPHQSILTFPSNILNGVAPVEGMAFSYCWWSLWSLSWTLGSRNPFLVPLCLQLLSLARRFAPTCQSSCWWNSRRNHFHSMSVAFCCRCDYVKKLWCDSFEVKPTNCWTRSSGEFMMILQVVLCILNFYASWQDIGMT